MARSNSEITLLDATGIALEVRAAAPLETGARSQPASAWMGP